MSKGMDWSKARKPRETEDYRGSAVTTRNGTRTPLVKGVSLATRAERELKLWLKKNPRALS